MRHSLSAAARALGVTEAAVRKAVANGRLEQCIGHDARGVHVTDLELLRQEWTRNADPAKQRTGGGDDGSITAARRRLTRAQARRHELLTRKLAGELMPVAEAKRETFDAIRTIRDNVLNVPDRVAQEFAAETDAAQIHARLDAELRQALGTAADELAEFEKGGSHAEEAGR